MNDIHFDTVGRAGLITFTRPKALNALSWAMIEAMGEALEEWARDDRIERVAVRGEGKAFSAGGDIRYIFENRDTAADYFAAEYVNNSRVAAFPKPYVALMDGIVMGGGVGVSMHGSHRIGTENLVFAMPEAGIGLVPDVGTTHLLANLADRQGLLLALTGNRLGRDEASGLGLLTHPVNRERLDDALDRVSEARVLDDALTDLMVEVEPLDAEAGTFVAKTFDAPSVDRVLERLDDAVDEHPLAGPTVEKIRSKSPTSLKVAFEAQRRHGEGTVRDALVAEYRMVCRILEADDLFEGIRAVVIDKDNAPRWSPAALEDVDEESVEAHFEPPEAGDIVLADLSAMAAS
ncbi:MAG: enoyl-CoA hydratase/isomerase family protein [Pseudomonadota bacterium]